MFFLFHSFLGWSTSLWDWSCSRGSASDFGCNLMSSAIFLYKYGSSSKESYERRRISRSFFSTCSLCPFILPSSAIEEIWSFIMDPPRCLNAFTLPLIWRKNRYCLPHRSSVRKYEPLCSRPPDAHKDLRGSHGNKLQSFWNWPPLEPVNASALI